MEIIFQNATVNVTIIREHPPEEIILSSNGSRFSPSLDAKAKRINEAKKLRKGGLSFQEIAEKMDLSYSTIYTYFRENV